MAELGSSPRRLALEERRKQKRMARRRRVLIGLGTGGLLLVLIVAGVFHLMQRGTAGLNVYVEGEILPVGDRLLVLVMGMDALEPNHTDTLMLVSLNSRTRHIGVLSIPRDTRVRIPGRTGFHRINVAHAIGGPERTVATVEQLLGVKIDHWVRLDFDGFRKVVDTVGGVEIHIDRPMVYTDKAQNLYIDLQPGTQILDGEKALQYVRYRADGLGDVVLADPLTGTYRGRVERQLNFVRALAAKVLQPAMLVRAPLIVPQLMEAVHTNMPLDKALRLAGSVNQVDIERMETVVLPGNAQTIGGASYWIPDEAGIREAVNRVLLGRHNMVNVVVLNGNGVSGVAARVAGKLRSEDLYVSRIGNADRYTYAQTLVIPLTGKVETARDIASLLGGRVAEDASVPATVDTAGVDIVVIVGRDYSG